MRLCSGQRKQWSDGEDEGGEQRYAAAEEHDPAVHAYVLRPGDRVRAQRQRQVYSQIRKCDPCQSTDQRQHRTLDEELPDDSKTAGADRPPHRQLALPRLESHEQQIDHVRAHHQQHERDRAQQRQQRRPGIGHVVVYQRLQVEEVARVHIREFGPPLPHQSVHLGACAFEIRTLSQTADRQQEVRAPADLLVRIECERRPQLRCIRRIREPGGHNAYDLGRSTIDAYRTPDHRGICAERAPPERMAEHNDLRAPRHCFRFGRDPA